MTEHIKNEYDTLPPPLHRTTQAGAHAPDVRCRSGGGRLEKFRRTWKYLGLGVQDVVQDRMPRIAETEFNFVQWSHGVAFCAYCGVRLSRETLTRDHVIPRAHGGGALGWDNLVPACQPCNGRKGSKKLIVFLAEYELH